MAAVTVPIDDEGLREDLRSFSKAWWIFLVGGIAWMIVGFAILSFDLTSVWLISLGFAFILALAGIEELITAAVMKGWRWLHASLGVIFMLGSVWAIGYPGQTFRTLAILIAWFLLIKGTATFCISIYAHGMPWWWVGVVTGLLEIVIAVWAIGYPGRSAVLLVLWAGISAVFRGIADIVLAFQARHLKKELAA